MQLFRIIITIGLSLNLFMFTYIFLKRCAFLLSFWALLITTMAFWFLFIGSGMQVCEQKLLVRGEKVKHHFTDSFWRKGIFFYNQAIPLVITTNLLFYLNNIFYLRDDLYLMIELDFLDKEVHNWYYMPTLLWTSHLLPLVALLIDGAMNRIRIPYHHLIFNIIFLAFYLLVSWSYQRYNSD